MKKNQIVVGSIIVLALLCGMGNVTAREDSDTPGMIGLSDDIAPYNGPIGADSPLHGLKIAFEDLDETFTFNDTRRIEKQVDHARLRIAETRRELAFNRTDTAERALELYRQKLNLTEMSLIHVTSAADGMLHAQEMITKHQAVLAYLSLMYPDNTGLSRAFNNSLSLGQKFEERTGMRYNRLFGKNNTIIVKPERPETGKQDRVEDEKTADTGTGDQGRKNIQEKQKIRNEVIPANATVRPQVGFQNNTPSRMETPEADPESLKNKGKSTRD